MRTRLLQSKRAHSDDDTEPPNSKRQKVNEESDIQNLDIDELLVKYGSNDQLNRNIEAVFQKKYANKTVHMVMEKQGTNEYAVVVYLRDDKIKVALKKKTAVNAVRFLETFGLFVTQIEIDYAEIENVTKETAQWKMVERLIIKKCAQSLTNLTLEHNKGNAFDGLRTPFKSVGHLQLRNCLVTSKTSLITKYFPNVKEFTLDGRGFGDLNRLNNSSVMSPQMVNKVKRIGFVIHADKKMLNLMEKYGPPNYSATEFLYAVNRNMTQLNRLMMFGINVDTSKFVVFESVTHLSIGHCDTKELEAMPLSFNKLKSMQLSIQSKKKEPSQSSAEPNSDDETAQPIVKVTQSTIESLHPTVESEKPKNLNIWTKFAGLTQLRFNPSKNYGNIDQDLHEIAEKLINLQDITIYNYENSFSKEGLERFITKCAKLQKLHIIFHYGIVPQREKMTKDLAQQFNKHWKVTQSTGINLIIERN